MVEDLIYLEEQKSSSYAEMDLTDEQLTDNGGGGCQVLGGQREDGYPGGGGGGEYNEFIREFAEPDVQNLDYNDDGCCESYDDESDERTYTKSGGCGLSHQMQSCNDGEVVSGL